MTMKMSAEGRAKLTEPWEECVLYVYDDKVPKRRGPDGKLAYPEWDGGSVRGTLTVGFGHTDAAGGLKIEKGLRLNREEADDLLSADLAPCDRRANAALKVPVTQHVYDGVADLDFNCPSAIPHVAGLINAGNIPAAQKAMLQYIYSRGERMNGLVNRRNAEIKWMNTPDDPEEARSAPQLRPSAPAACWLRCNRSTRPPSRSSS
jgi:lysozyme